MAMLSGLTLYLENHQELLQAKILPALMATIMDEHTVPQARPVAKYKTSSDWPSSDVPADLRRPA